MLNLDEAPASVDDRLGLQMGASLMLGWTVLLIWADRGPVERKGILLITIFPVVFGLALTTLFRFLEGYIPLKVALPVWILQTFLTAVFLTAYFHARKHGEELPHNNLLD